VARHSVVSPSPRAARLANILSRLARAKRARLSHSSFPPIPFLLLPFDRTFMILRGNPEESIAVVAFVVAFCR